MKKFLLLAAVAASMATASAEDFGTYFALTYEGEALTNGQTAYDANYYDPVLLSYPELSGTGYQSTSFSAEAKILATNIYDESMDLAFTVKRISPSIESVGTQENGGIGWFQICYNIQCHDGDEYSDTLSVDPDGEGVLFDIHQSQFTDLTPITFQLDFCVMEGGEKIEGTDCTIYLNFTHETDISLGVKGVEVEEDAAEVYYNLQGIQVATPEKGNVYIVRKGGKVSKKLF